MDNHPIPQDITGFQFKLIGEMTVKQFAYLAGGVVLGWLFIFILSPIPGIIRFPFGLIAAGLGIALAFLPVEGRPMDVMLGNFLLTLFRPNQYVFHKEDHQLLAIYQTVKALPKKQQSAKTQPVAPKYTEDQLSTLLQTMSQRPQNKWDQKEQQYLQSLGFAVQSPAANQPTLLQTPSPSVKPQLQMPVQTPVKIQPIIASSQPPTVVQASPIVSNPKVNNQNISPEQKEKELEHTADALEQQLQVAKSQEANSQNVQMAAQAHQKVVDLEKQLSDTTVQKQKLEQELLTLKKQLEANKQPVQNAPEQANQPAQAKSNVRVVSKSAAKAAGVPSVPEAPNLVTGIVKDSRGNPLANILIEVKDAEGNPVRAFKTNMLGNFASATALPNGTYTIEFEDPKGEQKFDVIQFETTGEVIYPLEVTSVDAREELRRSLFGTQPSSVS